MKHKIPGQEKSVYDQSTRRSQTKWFTNFNEFKDRTKQAIFRDLYGVLSMLTFFQSIMTLKKMSSLFSRSIVMLAKAYLLLLHVG